MYRIRANSPQDCIKQLQTLTYLYISACDIGDVNNAAATTTTETDDDDESWVSNSFPMYFEELEIAANQIFEALAPSCSKLNIVCLTVTVDADALMHRCAAFLRRLMKNAENTPTTYDYVIERIPYDEIKQYGTISESVARKYISWQESE